MIKGVFYNLESRKPRFIRCAGLFGHLPYEIPPFQQSHHIHILTKQPSLPEGIFSLNSLKIKVSLLFTLVMRLLTYFSSSFIDEISATTKKEIYTSLSPLLIKNTSNPYKITIFTLKSITQGYFTI